MLYYLLIPLTKYVSAFRIVRYISFRAAAAAVTALLVAFIVGPVIVRALRRLQMHQVVREGTPDSHQAKSQTPTMGGLIILTATIVPTLLWVRLDNRYALCALLVMIWMGGIGFLDDYLKFRQKREGKKNEGLVERYKLAGQVTAGLALGLYVWQ